MQPAHGQVAGLGSVAHPDTPQQGSNTTHQHTLHMSLITPDFGLLFWMTVVFLVVFLILWKWGFPVITKMVNERKAFIDDSLRKAHEANERLANIKAEGEQILQEAREQQTAILKEAAQTRDALIEQAQQKAKSEGARLISEAKAEIENEKQNALRDIKAQVATLSVAISEKVLRERLNNDALQMQHIQRLLDETTQQATTTH